MKTPKPVKKSATAPQNRRSFRLLKFTPKAATPLTQYAPCSRDAAELREWCERLIAVDHVAGMQTLSRLASRMLSAMSQRLNGVNHD